MPRRGAQPEHSSVAPSPIHCFMPLECLALSTSLPADEGSQDAALVVLARSILSWSLCVQGEAR